jgi:endonuclease I
VTRPAARFSGLSPSGFDKPGNRHLLGNIGFVFGMRFTRLPQFPATFRPGRPAAFPARVRRAAAFLLALPALLAAGLPAAAQAGEYAPPADYYAPAEGLAGEGLKAALNAVITGHSSLTYSQVWDNIRLIDADPDQANNIFLIYSGFSIPYTSGIWNREHVFPQSFGTGSTSSSAFSNGPGYTDLHHLFPSDSGVNSARSNLYFDYSVNGQSVPNAPGVTRDNDSFEPNDGDKGRIARVMFYMDVRYEGEDLERPTGSQTPNLRLGNFPNRNTYTMGRLDPLLEWNRKFGPDQRERRRNHLIQEGGRIGLRNYAGQGNRNPFVDYPELADAIYIADQYVTRGTWRITHFSFEELDDPVISGDLADPDGDGLVNLIELSANLDPQADDAVGGPQFVRAGNGSAFLNFSRLNEFAASGIEYRVEYSTHPLLSGEWSELVFDEQDVQAAPGQWTESLGIGDYLLPASELPYWLRLRVLRLWPVNDPAEAVSEPFRGMGWAQSPWLGQYADGAYPVVFGLETGWLHIAPGDRDSIRLWHPSAGWLLSDAGLFPFVFNPNDGGWYQFVREGVQPELRPVPAG